jgi:hypothetical protein
LAVGGAPRLRQSLPPRELQPAGRRRTLDVREAVGPVQATHLAWPRLFAGRSKLLGDRRLGDATRSTTTEKHTARRHHGWPPRRGRGDERSRWSHTRSTNYGRPGPSWLGRASPRAGHRSAPPPRRSRRCALSHLASGRARWLHNATQPSRPGHHCHPNVHTR